ncbi:MAG TPA: FKBP-type peptidyl-prolyl cis-trans isomerase [Phycisphaerae bacterium]|nr:FKBP-type peptidyl-prolyl cis-trans isomerase [Phycisphaerae bacterium]
MKNSRVIGFGVLGLVVGILIGMELQSFISSNSPNSGNQTAAKQSTAQSAAPSGSSDTAAAAENVANTPDVAPDKPATKFVSTQTLADGLVIQDVKIGNGPTPKSGDAVDVNYIGWLANGESFDSSYSRGQPFEFTLGQGQVIAGWDEGVATMKVGGIRQLVISANLAYGAQGQGPIPPNATLTFYIELLSDH